MEEDALKKFVNQHRDEFDVFEPRADLWQDIDKQLHPPRRRLGGTNFSPYLLRYAAALVLLMVAGVVAWRAFAPDSPPENLAAGQNPPLEQIAPEIAEIESYYTSLINQRREELQEYDLSELGVSDNVSRDVAALDSAYARLKQELITTPNKEPVIDAMIMNLQIRMEVLNQQIQTLNQIRRMQLNNKKS